MSKTTDGFSASSRSLNGLNSFNGDVGTFSKISVEGDIVLSNTSSIDIDGYNPSAGQIIKKTLTGMEWANEADNGIDLTEDNTGATNYEVILSNASTASNKTDFKTSALNFQPSTNTLTCNNFTGDVTGDVTGDLTGTASNATNATNATNAINASKVTVNVFSITGVNNLLQVPNTAGNNPMYATADLNYNSTTDILTTPKINLSSSVLQINGSVTNNMILKTNGSGELTFADETDGVTIEQDNTTNSNFGICFSDTTDGDTTTTIKRSNIASGLYYNPQTANRQLTLNGTFSQSKDCNLITASVTGAVKNINIADVGFIRIYDGVSSYPDPTNGHLLGCSATGMSYIDPATLGGITVSASTTNSDIPLLFQGAGSTSTMGNSTDLTFNPSTETLKVAGNKHTFTPTTFNTDGIVSINSGVISIDKASADTKMNFKNNGTLKWSIINDDGEGNELQIKRMDTTTINLKIKDNFIFNDGSVGINGTPYDELHIYGGLRISSGNASEYGENGWRWFQQTSTPAPAGALRLEYVDTIGGTGQTDHKFFVADVATGNVGIGINPTANYDLTTTSCSINYAGNQRLKVYEITEPNIPDGTSYTVEFNTGNATGNGAMWAFNSFGYILKTGSVSNSTFYHSQERQAVGGPIAYEGGTELFQIQFHNSGTLQGTNNERNVVTSSTTSLFTTARESGTSFSGNLMSGNGSSSITLGGQSAIDEYGGYYIKYHSNNRSHWKNISGVYTGTAIYSSGDSGTGVPASDFHSIKGAYYVGGRTNTGVAGNGTTLGNSQNYSMYHGITKDLGASTGTTASFTDGIRWDYGYNTGVILKNQSSDYVNNYTNQKTILCIRARGGSSLGDQGGAGSIGIKYVGYRTSANLYVNGNIYATGTITPSDSRIKDNQQDYDIKKALDTVLAIKLKTYEYNKYDDDGRQGQKALGYIAQELEEIEELNKYNCIKTSKEPKEVQWKVGEKVIPMPPNEDDPDHPVNMPNEVEAIMEKASLPEFKTVEKSKLIPFLIGAIQQQASTISSLEKRLSDLENHYFGI